MSIASGGLVSASSEQLYAFTIEAMRAPVLRLQLMTQIDGTKEQISEEAATLLHTIDALLLIEKTTHSQELLPLAPLNISPLFDDVLHGATPMLRARGITVENRISRLPVLAHSEATRYVSEQLLHAMCALGESSDRVLVARSRTYGERSDIGLYGGGEVLRARAVERLKTKQVMKREIDESKLHFYIADNLLALQGSRVRSSIFQKSGGLAFSLHKSNQLVLV